MYPLSLKYVLCGDCAEVQRVLRPGGAFCFVEHIAARGKHITYACSSHSWVFLILFGVFIGCSSLICWSHPLFKHIRVSKITTLVARQIQIISFTGKERKTTLMLPPAWIMMLLHFLVCLRLHVIPNGALRELEAPDNYCLLSRVNTLNGCGQPSWHLSPRANP